MTPLLLLVFTTYRSCPILRIQAVFGHFRADDYKIWVAHLTGTPRHSGPFTFFSSKFIDAPGLFRSGDDAYPCATTPSE